MMRVKGQALRGVPPDVWTGLALLAVSVVAMVQVTRIFVPAGLSDHLGPRAFPAAATIFLAATALIMVARSVRGPRDATYDLGSVGQLLFVLVASAAFVGLFASIGFVIASVGLLSAMFVRFGERRWWLALLVGAGVTLALDAAFALGLGVSLPGSLFGI